MNNLTSQEVDLIGKIQGSDNPLSITDSDLDQFVESIKRARGDQEKQLRRHIRLNVAKHHDWNFAMDGAFMPKQGQRGYPDKSWQGMESGMFGAAYARFERLAIYLHFEQGMSLEEVEAIAVSSVGKGLLMQ